MENPDLSPEATSETPVEEEMTPHRPTVHVNRGTAGWSGSALCHDSRGDWVWSGHPFNGDSFANYLANDPRQRNR